MIVLQIVGFAVLLVLAYLVGSIPFGYVVGKLFYGVDVRELGSGNVGTTNVDPALRAGEVGVVDGWRMYVGGASNTVVRPEACGAHARPLSPSLVWFDLVFVQGE